MQSRVPHLPGANMTSMNSLQKEDSTALPIWIYYFDHCDRNGIFLCPGDSIIPCSKLCSIYGRAEYHIKTYHPSCKLTKVKSKTMSTAEKKVCIFILNVAIYIIAHLSLLLVVVSFM